MLFLRPRRRAVRSSLAQDFNPGERLLLCLGLLFLPMTAFAAPRIPPMPPPVPATVQIRLPVVTPQMQRYSRTGDTLYFINTAYGWLLLAGILATGVSARLRDRAARLPGGRFAWLRLAWYYILLTLLLAVLRSPLTWYGGFWLDHAYGLSRQSFGGWLGDEIKGILVGAVLTLLLLGLLLTLIRKSPRRWALWLWGALIPIIAFGIFLAPLVVDPIFNKFTPLPPGPLRTQIQALAAQAGIPNAPIYVEDKSKQTETTNAYVTGIGSSARIVLWDTLLTGKNKMPDDQILAITGHEMGHYVLKHLYWGFAASVGGLLFALPLLQWIVQKVTKRFGSRWRITGLTDPAAIPIFLLVFGMMNFLADPLTNALSREIEHQADAYGIAVTQNRLAMAQAFVTLSEQNLSDPYPPPFIKFWLFTHPPLGERIDFALGRKSGAGRE